MSASERRASMWRDGRVWSATLEDPRNARVSGSTRRACLAKLRGAAGPGVTLTIEVLPALAGVAEAAAIMGWDKRRVITYLDRGSFPEPLASLASGRIWRRDDIEAFANDWRKRQRRRGRQ